LPGSIDCTIRSTCSAVFPAPIDHLGKALTQRAVMIDVREAKILEGELPQRFESLIVGKRAAPDFAQNLA
jgi:hypothetical protein